MNNNLQKINEILTATCQKIEQECGLKSSTFMLILLLIYIDPETWKFDRSLIAKIYQALEIIEGDDNLKQIMTNAPEVNKNETKE